MRAFILLVFLSASCLAQRPKPCKSPRLLTGRLTVANQKDNLMASAKYTYDALRQRIRLREFGSYNNESFHFDVLLLYQKGVMYKINNKNKTCCKKPMKIDFHPLAIPEDANLLGQVVLGSSSGPGQGVLVNSWEGELQMKNRTAKYLSTVTEFGCVPITTMFHTCKSGWMVTSFFNNVIGLAEPQELIPPRFCKDAQLQEEEDEDPATFFSLF